MNKHVLRAVSAFTMGALGATVAAGPADAASPAKAGTTSLAKVLAADGNRLDHNPHDFDILDRAVRAVLRANPDSAVGSLADGKTRLTAFLPTDDAFARLVGDLSGKKPKNERRTLERLTRLAGVDTIETVLLYHVVPGTKLNSTKVLRAARKERKLPTAQGKTVKVVLRGSHIRLKDKDLDLDNPAAIGDALDVNKGNRQIGHGIDRVLLPVDL